MFSRLFRKANNNSVPSGFVPYNEKDFQEIFQISEDAAILLKKDYISILQIQEKSDFGSQVIKCGRDLSTLSKILADRYKISKNQAGAVSLFIANIATARSEQIRRQDLGISKSLWLSSTCGHSGDSRNAWHAGLSGQTFDVAKGLRTEQGYLLPGVAVGCTCTSRPIIPGV